MIRGFNMKLFNKLKNNIIEIIGKINIVSILDLNFIEF